MARLRSKGFEFNSATAGMEWSDVVNAPTIVTSPVRSGTYAGSIPSLTSGVEKFFEDVFATSDQAGDHFVRYYLYITTLPNVTTTISAFVNTAGDQTGWIDLTTTGVLELFDGVGNSVGTSSALNTGQWYRIEHKHGATTTIDEFKIDGTVIATTATGGGGSIARYRLGGNIFTQTTTTISIQFDDYAINNTAAGAGQTGYPGDAKLVLALPTGAGDNAATTGTFSMINEIPPSDTATTGVTMIELDTNTSIGDYAMTDSSTLGIASGDTIQLVDVYARVREETAGTSNYTLRIKSASGGTVSASTSVDAGDATPRTNPSGTTAFGTRLVSYTDPTTAAAWTPTGTNSIDNMQVGAATTDGTPDIWVLWLGAYIEYVPSATTTSTSSTSSSISTSSTSSSISTSSTSSSISTSSTSSSTSTSSTSSSRSTSTSSTSSSVSTSSTSSSRSTSTSSTSSSRSTSTSSTSSSISTSSTSSSISTSSTSSSISTSSTSSSISTSSTSSSISISTSSTSSSTSLSTSSTSSSVSTSTSSTSSSTSFSTSSTSSSTSTTQSFTTSTSSTSTSFSTSTTALNVMAFPRPRIRPEVMGFRIKKPRIAFR